MTSRLFCKILTYCPLGRRRLHITTNLSDFYQKDRKSGYKVVYDRLEEPSKLSIFGRMREGYRQLKVELGIWMEEVREHLRADPTFIYRPDEIDIVWRFNGDPKSLYQWVITCDSDYNEGFSKANLELSPTGTGVFSGVLSTRLPKDGKVRYSGYCNVTTVNKEKSFRREVYHDWTPYTHLILRVRGDGRCYSLNISTRGIFDLTWNDMYNYVLYTRGGPHWQYVKLPFSKFIFSSKGALQDDQIPIALNEVSNFGITVSDDISGQFRLEIDYIGLERDEYQNEEFAYETYDNTDLRF